MRDFPIFTTDFGVSSLVLREIPYKKEAYICIREVFDDGFQLHLQECVSFCKMAGAEKVFATGHLKLEMYPHVDSLLEMRCEALPDGELVRNLFPVTEKTVSQWREIYNRRMRSVFNSRTLEGRDEKELLESTGAYFVHDRGELLGIGWIQDNRLLAIAAELPGMGTLVLNTMLSLIPGDSVCLEVANSNLKAIRLYEKIGFVRTQETARWYDVSTPGER